MTTSAPPVCAANRFPTVVVGPCAGGGGPTVSKRARTVITCPDGDQPARLLVWTAPGAPVVDAAIDLEPSYIGRPTVDWLLRTDAGDFVVRRSGACSCGRLKHWQPFEPMTMGSLP